MSVSCQAIEDTIDGLYKSIIGLICKTNANLLSLANFFLECIKLGVYLHNLIPCYKISEISRLECEYLL